VTTILATCPTCGDMCLTPGDLSVRHDDDATEYRFSCQFCARVIRKEADVALIEALVRVGVPFERDVAHRFHPSYVPPIDESEVSAFCAALDDADWLAEWLRDEGRAA
jgi:hypothetical protein